MEQCWRTAESIRKQKALIIDLVEVTFIDADGKALLESLAQAGAEFVATAPLTKAICSECAKARGGQAVKRAGRTVLPLLLLLAIGGTLRAQEKEPVRLTLREAVAMALRRNPNVQVAALNVAESREDVNIARSALLPQAGFQAADLIRRGNIEANIGKPIPFFPQHVGPWNTVQGGAGFSAPVFDLTLWRRWQAFRQGVEANQAQEQAVHEQYVALVVSQYLGSLRAAADVRAARSRVDLAQALFNLASDVQKSGAGTRIDTLRADVQLANEKQRLIVADTQLKTSLFGLARLLNLDPRQPVELTDQMTFFETPSFSAEESLEHAWQARPEMKALAARTRALEIQKRAAAEAHLPKLSISAGWMEQGLTPANAIPTYQYQATVDVPLFTGGRIRAERARAVLELRKIAQDEQELKNRIALEVKTAAAQLDSARNEVDVANRAARLADEEVAQAQDRFRAGVANNVEVIQAQDSLTRAADNQINALYRYNQARADLARAIGQMEVLYAR